MERLISGKKILGEQTNIVSWGGSEGFNNKNKKSGNFSDLVRPTQPSKWQKYGGKMNFYCSKMILRQLRAVLEEIFFNLKNVTASTLGCVVWWFW